MTDAGDPVGNDRLDRAIADQDRWPREGPREEIDALSPAPEAAAAPWHQDLIALALADGEPLAGATAAILELDDGDCRWPIGEPSNPDFRFCRAPRRPGRAYCRRHAGKAGSGRLWPANRGNGD